jgi:quinol monooxygenase YgiN
MSKYLLNRKLTAKAGSLNTLTEIMLLASEMIMTKAKGCQLYAIGHSTDIDETVYITEIWDSKADHEASLKIDGVKELISKAVPLFQEMPTQGQEITVLN